MANDIQINWDSDLNQGDFDFDISTHDLEIDKGLETAVMISLFTDQRASDDDILPDSMSDDKRGWWGDLVSDIEGDQIGSKLWLLETSKTTKDFLIKYEMFTREALQWLINDGVAAKVDVQVERRGIPGNDQLIIGVEIFKPDGSVEKFNFEEQWDAQHYKSETLNIVTSGAEVTTQAISGIVGATATGHGTVVYLGTGSITQHGVCWSTSAMPTTDDSKTTEGAISNLGAFTSNIAGGLATDTVYYVRAYVTDTYGTNYGEQVSFKTDIFVGSGITLEDDSGGLLLENGDGLLQE